MMKRVCAVAAAIGVNVVSAASNDKIIGFPVSPLGCPYMVSILDGCTGFFVLHDHGKAWLDTKDRVLVYADKGFTCCASSDYADGKCANAIAEGDNEAALCAVSDQFCPQVQITGDHCMGVLEQSDFGQWTREDGVTTKAVRNADGELEMICSINSSRIGVADIQCDNPVFKEPVHYGLNKSTVSLVDARYTDEYIYIPKLGSEYHVYPMTATNSDGNVRLGGASGKDETKTAAAAYPTMSTIKFQADNFNSKLPITVYNRDRFVDSPSAVVVGAKGVLSAQTGPLTIFDVSAASFSFKLGECSGTTGSMISEAFQFLITDEGVSASSDLGLTVTGVIAHIPVDSGVARTTVTHRHTNTYDPTVFVQAAEIEVPASATTDAVVQSNIVESTLTQVTVELNDGTGPLTNYGGKVHMISLSPDVELLGTDSWMAPYFNSTYIMTQIHATDLGFGDNPINYSGLKFTETPFSMVGTMGNKADTSDGTAAVAQVGASNNTDTNVAVGGVCEAAIPAAVDVAGAFFAIGSVENIANCVDKVCNKPTMTGQCVADGDAGYECVCRPEYQHPKGDKTTCIFVESHTTGSAQLAVGSFTTIVVALVALAVV